MRKFLTSMFVMALALACLFVLPLQTQAMERTVVDGGTCGENLTWTLYDDGKLIISGTGTMENYSHDAQTGVLAPWHLYSDSIKTITIESNVTTIGDAAFSHCANLENVIVGRNVETIGDYAFAGCSAPMEICFTGDAPRFGTDAVSQVTIFEDVTVMAYYPADNATWTEGVRQNYGGQITWGENAAETYTVLFQDWNGNVIETQTYNAGEKIVPPADPTRTPDSIYTYTFAGWKLKNDNQGPSTPIIPLTQQDLGVCTGNATYVATYDAVMIDYTVVFRDWDGTILYTQSYHWNEKIVVPEDPTRAADNTYTYTFDGWKLDDDQGPSTPIIPLAQQDLGVCRGNATYVATYDYALRDYTVVFRDWDGTVLSTETYHWNEEVAVPADPTRAEDNTYTYTFAGWTPEVAAACAGDATYTATYTETYKEYTVVFKNWDGTVLSSKIYHWGDTVAVPATPTKAATAEYTYTFAGWTPEVVAVAGNATYTATFTATKNSYTITWKNDDGSVIDTTTVEYGVVPTHAAPAKAATAEYTYTFAGWTPEVVAVTGNATYTATYTATKNSYTITWKNDDGSVIDTTTVAYGVVPTHAAPTKAATAEYTYTFAGWTPEVVAVTGNATYTATYTATKNSYTITWKNDDGSVIDTTTVEYGVVPTHAAPTKAATAEYTYTFAGWTPEVVAVTGNATYTATYTATKNSYTITWKNDDGSVIDTTTVAYGVVPTHAAPTKAATAEYTYTFAGWTPEVVAVTGNATYTATYTATKNSYTITWKNDDGSVIDTTTVAYGVVPTHAVPTKAADNTYTYTFAGWTPEVVAVTGNATYTATYTKAFINYTVTFQYEDGTVIETKTYHWGDTVTAPADPEAPEGFAFKGWTPEITVCQGNAVYTAVFEQLPPAPHVVTWVQATTSLEGNIGLNFYVKLSDSLVNDPTTAMRFVFNGTTVDIPLSQAAKIGDQYKFTFLISAKNMADNVNAQIVISDGPVGDAKNLTVMTYCNYMINNSKDAKLVSLMKAMLNYGASAQILFNHNTDNLANASLSAEDKILADVDASAYAHSLSGSEDGIRVDNATLILETETTARIYFKLTGSKTIDQYTFMVDGKVVQAKPNGALYYVEIPNIAAQHLDEMHTVTVGGLTIRYGGLSYVNQVIKNPQYATEEMTNTAKALFAYNKMAENYFN